MTADPSWPVDAERLAAEIRISPLSEFEVARSGDQVAARCRLCDQHIRPRKRAMLLDLVVLDALKHRCPAPEGGDRA